MTNPRILVVDDEAVIREGIRRILEKEGYQVEPKSSGRVALEKLQEAQIKKELGVPDEQLLRELGYEPKRLEENYD